MNTRKFTGDMSSQVEADRDELIELRSRITTLLAVIEQCEVALEEAKVTCESDDHDQSKHALPMVESALAAIKKVKSQ